MPRRATLFLLLAVSSLGEKAKIGFGNDCSGNIDGYWVDNEGNERKVATLEPQSQTWIDTYFTHRFVFRDGEGKKVGDTTVNTASQFVAVQCDHPCHTDYIGEECLNTLDGFRRQNELQALWDRQNADRLEANAKQPANLKNFTELGFEKRDIPEDVWEVLNTYYQANKDSIVLEKWPSSNPYINHWEAVPMMIWLPELHTGDRTKQKIFDGLRPHLEEWSGTKLEQTDLYGMRVYKNNTFLENHVDRVATHVISTIMHVADSNDHEWPLEILDHNGQAHNITIKPGEMVLYESATCVHGRPSKFQGEYYVNAFAHFRPVDWIPYLRKTHTEGKLTKWSRGPGNIDDQWLSAPPKHDEL